MLQMQQHLKKERFVNASRKCNVHLHLDAAEKEILDNLHYLYSRLAGKRRKRSTWGRHITITITCFQKSKDVF